MIRSPYDTQREFTVEEGCPWYEAQQEYGAPNVNWCEPTSCAVINEPANTWSNLSIILVGLVLIRKMNEPVMRFFGVCVAFMGVFSFTYHATNNFLSQYIDFLGMFLTMSFLLAFSFLRALNKDPRKIYSMFWFIFSLHAIIFMLFDIMDIAVQKIMLVNAIPVILFDLYAGFRDNKLGQYKFFFLSLLCLAVAQAFAIMDIQRIYCNPDNLVIHGHVLWHLVSSVGMLFYGLHMNKQIKRLF